MTTPLDYSRLESICWRALCRHQVSELEMVVAATVIRLSFVVGQPCLRLDYAIELSRLTGLSKGKASDVVQRLVRSRALEVSADRRVYTFLPPSPAWPWLFAPRVDARIADELEAGILWAQRGPQQDDFYSPPVEQEWTGAQALEQLRAELLAAHHAADARGGEIFPVTDRLPTPAPASRLSSGEGRSRPLESAGCGGTSADVLSPEHEEAITATQPGSFVVDREAIRRSIEGSEAVPDSGTGSRIGNSPLRALKASEGAKALNPLKALRAGFPNREPLDPAADEAAIIAWLRGTLGPATMEQFGGWWRLRIRESRWAAVNTCMELHLRLTDRHLKPLRNPGGWARDQYLKIRGEERELTEPKS